MVTEYGMSDLGPVQLEHKNEGVFLGLIIIRVKFLGCCFCEISKKNH